ncbi:LysR family transcriptional regulator [Ruania halotolerans]|uniref:LysR family transcriptional regulator n=1 Tax=Ruania halotolerans TaxID=2897773 RepID=UPI001E5DE4FC|nr:LysR family transcriptional regulator [Ruania halotolerans]UFU07325.1 LysR family transcriptional regulator [Ruania halotolerans]
MPAPKDVTLDMLRLLVAVADRGSISAAARAAGVSQPSASARIKDLERRLGLELVDRRSRGAQLTTDGRTVTDWARAVVDAAEVLITGAQALAGQHDSQLTVAASQTVGEYLMPAWLAAYRRRSAGLPVRLRVMNSADVVAALRAREVDLGFVESPAVPADLARRRVGTDRLTLVVGPEHPLARRRRPLTRDQLLGLALASREDGSGTRDTLTRALGQPVRPALELGSNAAVKVEVASGGYPAVLSALAVNAEISDGRLVEIDLPGVDLSRHLHAVWRRGVRLPAPADDFLRGVLGR